jgi:hypothetical protein
MPGARCKDTGLGNVTPKMVNTLVVLPAPSLRYQGRAVVVMVQGVGTAGGRRSVG